MYRGWISSIAALSALALAGCAGLQHNEAKTMKPVASPFDQALYKEYIGQSKSEYDQADYRSSDLWAEKAMLAAKGQTLNSHAKCNAGIDRSCDGSEV
jgi:hypothetical protein